MVSPLPLPTVAVIFAALTGLIYGVLYTNSGYQALFLQGPLGYSPLGAALIGIPTGILLTVLSTRVGTLSGRYGVRPFLVAGLHAHGPSRPELLQIELSAAARAAERPTEAEE